MIFYFLLFYDEKMTKINDRVLKPEDVIMKKELT